MADIAKQMEAEHLAIVANALNGKPSFSGWPKAPIAGVSTPDGLGGLKFAPSPVSRGSEQVAQSGRRGGKHGTTKGKNTWSQTMELFRLTIPPKVLAGYEKVMLETFGGP